MSIEDIELQKKVKNDEKSAKNVILDNLAYCVRDAELLNKDKASNIGDVEKVLVKYADKIREELGLV